MEAAGLALHDACRPLGNFVEGGGLRGSEGGLRGIEGGLKEGWLQGGAASSAPVATPLLPPEARNVADKAWSAAGWKLNEALWRQAPI